MDLKADTSMGYLVNHLARLFARRLEGEIKPRGIALGAFPALLHLWEKDGLTQKELVMRLGVEQPTMAATLSRMERDGLIYRHRDEGDARVQRIRLTQKALALRADALADAAQVNADALAGLSDIETKQLMGLMKRVILQLDETLPAGRAAP